MKSHAFTFFLLSLLLLTAQTTFAQKPPIKFGKIDMEDLKMTHYPLDSSAHAVVLCNYGYASFEYNQVMGSFFINYDRHVRYKIIDKAGYEFANYSIPLYQPRNSSSNNEQIISFKASVFNLKNGDIEETKFPKKDMLSEATTEYYTIERLAMPNVQEGSVIDIKYTVRSPFISNFPDWNFQTTIPTKYSEFIIKYPDWFDYKTNFSGYDFDYLTVNDQSKEAGAAYNLQVYRWVAEGMPAFESEAYMSSDKNFLTRVEFELTSTNINGIYKSYSENWGEVSGSIWKSDNFGGQLSKMKVKSLEKDVAPIIAGKTTKTEITEAIYDYVKNTVLWNEWYGIYSSGGVKKALKEQKGSCADINLLLTAMLRAAGMEANPVVLSTRQNGYLKDWSPSYGQFNYLICAVKNENDTYQLIDATDRSLPMNVLPPRCINGKGLMIGDEKYRWLDLTPNNKYRHVRQVKATLTDDLIWTGTMNVKCKDYAARQMRQDYLTEGDEKSYVQMIQNENTGLNLTNPTLEEMETMAKETKAAYDMTLADNVMDGGEMLYFNPMLTFAVEENPFKLKERKYPVDYNYPYEYIYSASFEIPENYAIEELPESLSLALPEKGGRFSYTISANGNTINLTSQLKISKYLFLPEEYAGLKEFYNLLVDKMAAQVVLKKKE